MKIWFQNRRVKYKKEEVSPGPHIFQLGHSNHSCNNSSSNSNSCCMRGFRKDSDEGEKG